MDVSTRGLSVNGDAVIRRQQVWSAREGVEGELSLWEMIKNGALHGESQRRHHPDHKQPQRLRHRTQTFTSSIIPRDPFVALQITTVLPFTPRYPIPSPSLPSHLDVPLPNSTSPVSLEPLSYSMSSRPKSVCKSYRLLRRSVLRGMRPRRVQRD